MKNDNFDLLRAQRLAAGISDSEVGEPVVFQRKNTETKFYIDSGFVCYVESRYWYCFIGGGHGGPMIIKEIKQQEYLDVRAGILSSRELCSLYPEQYGDADKCEGIAKSWIENGFI